MFSDSRTSIAPDNGANPPESNAGHILRTVIMLVLIVFGGINDIYNVYYYLRRCPNEATLGATFDRSPNEPNAQIVGNLSPASPLHSAGIAKGDTVHFPNAFEEIRAKSDQLAVGEQIHLMRKIHDRWEPIVVTAIRAPKEEASSTGTEARFSYLNLVYLTSGAVIFFRGDRKRSKEYLGIFMRLFGVSNPVGILATIGIFPLATSVFSMVIAAIPAAVLLFVTNFHAEKFKAAAPRLSKVISWVGVSYLLMSLALTSAILTTAFLNIDAPLIGYGNDVAAKVFGALGIVIALIIMSVDLTRCRVSFQKRFRVFFMAVILFTLSQLFGIDTLNDNQLSRPLSDIMAFFLAVGSLLSFIYATRRHAIYNVSFSSSWKTEITCRVLLGIVLWAIFEKFGHNYIEQNYEALLSGFSHLTGFGHALPVDILCALAALIVGEVIIAGVKCFWTRDADQRRERLLEHCNQAERITDSRVLLHHMSLSCADYADGAVRIYLANSDGNHLKSAAGEMIGCPEFMEKSHALLQACIEKGGAIHLENSSDFELGAVAIPMWRKKSQVDGMIILPEKANGLPYEGYELEFLERVAHDFAISYASLLSERPQKLRRQSYHRGYFASDSPTNRPSLNADG